MLVDTREIIIKRQVGVTPEVNLRVDQVTKHAMTHPGSESQRRHHQKKTEVSVVP